MKATGLTSFERRQRLVELVVQQPGLRVPEIANRLGVSQGTIRNDLNSLAATGQLTRVRGGATLTPDSTRSPAFATRARINQEAKRRIARRAAQLVEDGDRILLDASTTVYHMAACLRERRNLTVITNGLQVADRLAPSPSNTVILLGGILVPDGTSVTGPLSEQMLKGLHVKMAFVSCSGLASEAGLTDVDIHEAHLKARAITCADSVVALIDATKFGHVDLTPFAQLDQVSRIFTDAALDPCWLGELAKRGVEITVCKEEADRV